MARGEGGAAPPRPRSSGRRRPRSTSGRRAAAQQRDGGGELLRGAAARRAHPPRARLEEVDREVVRLARARPGAARSSPRPSRPGRAARASPPGSAVSSCSGRAMRSKKRLSGRNASLTVTSRLDRVLELLEHRPRPAGRERVGGQQQDRQAVDGRGRGAGEHVRRARADRGGAGERLRAAGRLGVADARRGPSPARSWAGRAAARAPSWASAWPSPRTLPWPKMPEHRRDRPPADAVALGALRLQPAHERLAGREPDRRRSSASAHRAVQPPSTQQAGPVISAAAGEAAKTTAPATSSGCRAARAGSARARRRGTPGRRGTARSSACATNVGAIGDDADAARRELDRHRLGQSLDRVLGRAVDGCAARAPTWPICDERNTITPPAPADHPRAPRAGRRAKAGAHVERPEPVERRRGRHRRTARGTLAPAALTSTSMRVDRARTPPSSAAASVTSQATTRAGAAAPTRAATASSAAGDAGEQRDAGAAPAARDRLGASPRRCRGWRP